MKDMTIIETRDPLENRDVESSAELLVELRQSGLPCTLMLAENGVLAARASARNAFLSTLAEQGVEIVADRFALAERGIDESELCAGVSGGELGLVIDRLAAGGTVIWR